MRRQLFFVASYFLFFISFLIAEDPTELWIDRFDNGNGINALKGASGAWNLDPSDDNQSYDATYDSKSALNGTGFCLKISYDVDSPVKAQGGYWTKLNRTNFSMFDTFEFYVRADAEKGAASLVKVQFKKKKEAEGPEMLSGSYVVTEIGSAWKKVQIPINKLSGISNWHDIEEMVIVLEDRRLDKKMGTFYFDDFRVFRSGNPGPSIYDSPARKIDKESNQLEGKARADYLIKRLKGFPSQIKLEKNWPVDNQEFLKTIAQDTWNYFDKIVDQKSGLLLDNIAFDASGTLTDKTFVGDYTNITNVGLYLMCVASAVEWGFITKEEAIERLKMTIQSIHSLERYGDFLYNYYDTTTQERTSNFVSYVDSGWLTIGMIVARNAFPELKPLLDPEIERTNYSFFYDNVEQQMYHGYYENVGVYAEYHYGVFYTEPRAISYMSIGKGDVPLEHWFKMVRTFPSEYDWQQMSPKARSEKESLGIKYYGGYYEYKDQKYWPSWGGSAFEALMPTLVLKEKELAPKGLGLNDMVHAKLTIQYALEDLGYPVWGMSPCSVPGGGYSEFGAKFLGVKSYPQGVVTPHATFLVLQFLPEEAIQNLRKMLELYPDIYGEYGFYDSVNVQSKLVEKKYTALDQGMSFLALTNYFKSGIVRQWFHQDEIAKNVEKLLEVESIE